MSAVDPDPADSGEACVQALDYIDGLWLSASAIAVSAADRMTS